MELKTKIQAEKDRQDLTITREFDLPVALLFKAYTTPEIVAQWMGTKVVKLENHQHGGYHFETTDPKGNVHVFHGVIHDLVAHQAIVRTFEMSGTGFAPQLEFLNFEKLSDQTSKLSMQIIYKSEADRQKMLALPSAQGLNMAHNRLEEIANQLKQNR